jgi:hypothetical protein
MIWLWVIRNFDVVRALLKIANHLTSTFGKEQVGKPTITIVYDDIFENYFMRVQIPIFMTGPRFYALQREFNGKVLATVKDKTLYKMIIWTIPTKAES